MTDRTEALDIEATKRKVQEIENRLRNASEGRWEIVLQGEERRTLYGVRSIEPGEEPYEIVDCWQGEEDAVLIACAPDDLRTLIQALRASNEERERVRAVLERIAEIQPHMLAVIRKRGFVFDFKLDAKMNTWEMLAFSLYSTLCEIDADVRALLIP